MTPKMALRQAKAHNAQRFFNAVKRAHDEVTELLKEEEAIDTDGYRISPEDYRRGVRAYMSDEEREFMRRELN